METRKKTMRIKRIKIPKHFALPSATKMRDKYRMMKRGDELSTITVNRHRELVDGYCTYLLAKMLGAKLVIVKVVNNE